MATKKSLIVAAAVATIGLSSVAGLGLASAQSNSGNGQSNLIDKIASQFNLNKDDVKKVFDENRTEMEAKHQEKVSERLQKAVDNGKLTADQKTKIEAKLKEIQSARETDRTEMEKWASDNKIDMKYLMGHHRGGEYDTFLQDAVDNGEITADQKTLIESKQNELEDKRKAVREELKKWASDNNIDDKYIMMGRGHGPMGGGRGQR